MIVCVCSNINERQWREALTQHADDAQAAAQACGAGQCCGSCVPTLDDLARPSTRALGSPQLALA